MPEGWGGSEGDAARAWVASRTGCARPVRTALGVWVRCGSRRKLRCEACAKLYHGDWSTIGRSGIVGADPARFAFFFLTLTAPSFGAVHRVPKNADAAPKRCGCMAVHAVSDVTLRGVPLDSDAYDYDGQAAWNRDSGVLWSNTVRRLRDVMPTLEFFMVREWQARGVLHVHALVRVAWCDRPSAERVRVRAMSAQAASKVDGTVVGWGQEGADCQPIRADGDAQRRAWYIAKALNYTLKDVAADAEGAPPVAVWEHQFRLGEAAARMRCSRDCEGYGCPGRAHKNYGARGHVVSASRPTRERAGWSFTGLTRTKLRRKRYEWWLENVATPAEREARGWPGEAAVVERAAVAAREEVAALCPAGP